MYPLGTAWAADDIRSSPVERGGVPDLRDLRAERQPLARGTRPSGRARAVAGPARDGKWRPGRIVPPRTPPQWRRNRRITRKSSGASEGPRSTILPEGYSVGSWWRFPVRTIHVRLDHGGPTVVPGGGVRVSASGARRRRAPWSARSSGNRRARHLTREHVCQSDVLAGQVTCSRVRVRSRGLSDVLAGRGASRHARRRPTMRDALSRRSGDGAPEPPGPPPTTAPADPTAPNPPTHPEATRADRHQRPSRSTSSKPPLNNLPGAPESGSGGAADRSRRAARTGPGDRLRPTPWSAQPLCQAGRRFRGVRRG